MFTVEFEVDGRRNISQFKQLWEAEEMFSRLNETTGIKQLSLVDRDGKVIRMKGYVYGN